MNKIKQTFQKVKMMTDPTGYIKQSPEMQNVLNMVNQNGGDAKSLFYELAKQKGVDPNQILDMFK
jgi:hypothetical protein